VVELLLLAAPTIAQMASYTVMQFADTYMLSRVGDAEATAAGLGGMAAFSLISFGVGVLMVVNALVSQSFGRGDLSACGRYLWQGIWFSVLFGLAVMPLLWPAGALFRALGHEARFAAMEATFFRLLLLTAAVKLAAVSLGQFLIAVNRPNVVLLAASSAMVADVFFNWLFVFGNWGFRPMGVAGSAWATNTAVTLELLVLALFVWRPSVVSRFRTLDWKPRRAMLRSLLAVGIPSGVQVVAEVVAWTLFTVWIVALFDETTMAANNYTFRFMAVSFMPIYGLSTAVTALVGRYIGMGRPDLAAKRAHLGFVVAAVYTVACGALFYFGRSWLMGLFTTNPRILHTGGVLLVFAAAYQAFDALYIIYNGALRGAGDTFVPAVATAALCWGITVFGGYAVARLRPGWGVGGPWAAALAYGVILGVWMFARFKRGRWKLIKLDGGPRPVDEPPPERSNVPAPSDRVVAL
jgi:MATE family multidrug resistance protein